MCLSRPKVFTIPQSSRAGGGCLLNQSSPPPEDTTELTFYHCRLVLLILKLHSSGIILYVLMCVCLLSLSAIFLRLIHVAARVSSSFPFTAE